MRVCANEPVAVTQQRRLKFIIFSSACNVNSVANEFFVTCCSIVSGTRMAMAAGSHIKPIPDPQQAA